MSKVYKIINGKSYKPIDWFSTKKEANKHASYYRARGYSTRIILRTSWVNNKKGYSIYIEKSYGV